MNHTVRQALAIALYAVCIISWIAVVALLVGALL